MPGSDDRAFQAFINDLQSGTLTYEEAKRRYLELGDRIRDQYEHEITALSIDVVHSRFLKGTGSDLDAQLTFDAYHRWVEQVLNSHGCHQHTWAGDGLLAIFQQAEGAVSVGRAVIEGLPRFNNSRDNRLGRPLQVRVGVHTGTIMAEDETDAGLGKIASRTFDLAGHLQKAAAPNQMLISDTTYTLLREGGGQFVPVTRELPNPGACFAFPPHTASIPTPSAPAPAAPAPAARPASMVPWYVLGVGGVVATTALTVVLVNRLMTPAPAPKAGNLAPVMVASQPGAPPAANPPAPAANTPAAPAAAGNPSPANAPAPAAVPAPAPAPAASPWEPARSLWRSPDADSGLPPQFTLPTPERKWILSIGVGRYAGAGLSADGAGEDAQRAAQALQVGFKVPPDHVRVVTDSQATKDGIKQAFQWLQSSATSGQDTVILYLAGAAASAPDRADLRHPGGSGYALAPYDGVADNLSGTGVFGADIAAWLGATRAQMLVVLADSPFASTLDLPPGRDPGRQFALIAADGVARRAGGGPMASGLTQGLQGAADLDRNGEVTLDELRRYLEGEVPRRSGGAQSVVVRTGLSEFLPRLVFTQ